MKETRFGESRITHRSVSVKLIKKTDNSFCVKIIKDLRRKFSESKREEYGQSV